MVNRQGSYIPDRGDIVFLDFEPTKGREQRGTRPALILSPASYNKKSSLAIFMPITNRQKGYPFEVVLPSRLKTSGVILVDQVKSLDWKVRNSRFVESVPENIVREVQAKIEALLL